MGAGNNKMAKQLTIISTIILHVPDDFDEERDMGKDLNISDMIEFIGDMIEENNIESFNYSIGTMLVHDRKMLNIPSEN